jgi:hypothetical protein
MSHGRYGPSSQDERISKTGREQCAAIERQRRAIFTQMAALLRQDNPQDESEEGLAQMIDNWAQAEVDHASNLEAKTPLEKLLKQHHDLGEDIMDVVAENLPCD